MTSQTIQAILTLADTMNFSKAAARTNITQPAFSRMISRAEEELGFKIFLRNTRSVSLTKEGEAFLASLRQADAIYRTGVSYSRAMLAEKNRLNLGFADNHVSISLSPAVVSFSMQRPDIHVACIPMPMDEIPIRIRANGIDIGFIFSEQSRFSTDLSSLILNKIPLNAVINRLDPLANRRSIRPEELESQHIISLQRNVGSYEIDSYGAPLRILNKKHGIHLEASSTATNIQDQLMRVACNQGLTLLAATLQHLIPKNTVMIPIEEGVEFNLTAVWKRNEESRAMHAFLSKLQEGQWGF